MFVVCGEALFDLYAMGGDKGLSFDARIGGSPFNVAVGLARLNQPVALFTALSSDALGRRLRGVLAAERVETGLLVRSERPTTLSLVEVGADGMPTYAFYGEGSADRALQMGDIPSLGDDVWGLHVGSFSMVTEPVGSTLLALVRRNADRCLVTLDPNVRITVEPDRECWRARADAFARSSALIKVSQEDLDLLSPGQSRADMATRWRDMGVELVIVTRGEAGAAAFGSFGQLEVSSRPVAVADTVGAGDSFMAALIAGLAERGVRTRDRLRSLSPPEIQQLLEFARDAAAITCGRRGADLPRRSELGHR